MQLKQRIITAAILIPVIVLATWYANSLFFAVLSAIFIGLGAWEWAGLSGWSSSAVKIFYLALVMVLLILCFLWRYNIFAAIVMVLAVSWWVVATVLVVLQQRSGTLRLGGRWLKPLIGLVILVPAWLGLVLLQESRYFGPDYVIFLLALTWLADSAAYFTGRQWGKTRLASVISPGKTWQGVFGAVFAGAVAGLLFALATGMQVPDIIIFSIICVITVAGSIVGDLIESLVKRVANVKDSGRIFPGHGGMLDRIDSLTAAAPVFLAGLWLMRGLSG